LILLLIAGVCGALGQAIAGTGRGGILVSIALGFIGALLGTWLAGAIGLPEILPVSVAGKSFPIIWATVGDFFGRRNFATIRGMMSFFYMWGSFAGPVMAGAIYDRTQSYLAVLWILLALLLFATLLVLFLIRPWTKRMAMLAPASCP